jgi:hypothetical protein
MRSLAKCALRAEDEISKTGFFMGENEFVYELYCPACGYDLRQIDSARCPECGLEIDRSKLGESIIPWVHRKKLGEVRAFFRTCALVSLHPQRLAREMNVPARLPDARKFRRGVVLMAILPLGFVLMICEAGLLGTGRTFGSVFTGGSLLEKSLLWLSWPCLAVALYSITGAAGYFFAPKSLTIVQQNRAIAISYYACAPMAYLPFLLLVAVALVLVAGIMSNATGSVIATGAFLLPAMAIMILYPLAIVRTPAVILRALTHCGAERQALITFLLPLIWLFDAMLFIAIIPGLMLIGVIIFQSFRP